MFLIMRFSRFKSVSQNVFIIMRFLNGFFSQCRRQYTYELSGSTYVLKSVVVVYSPVCGCIGGGGKNLFLSRKHLLEGKKHEKNTKKVCALEKALACGPHRQVEALCGSSSYE